MSTITLIRHAQASFGAADYDCLSPLGRRQAQLLGEWFARCHEPVDEVVCGTLRRHRDTATICLRAWGVETPRWRQDPAFDEFDFQDVLVRHRPELAEEGAIRRCIAEHCDGERAFQRLLAEAVTRWVSGGDAGYRESWAAFVERVIQGYTQLPTARTDGPRHTLVFTSGGPLGVILRQLLKVPDATALELIWVLYNTAITRVRRYVGGERLIGFNGIAHLQGLAGPEPITRR